MQIEPYVSVDKLRFGDSRIHVRDALGQSHKPFNKASSANPTDAYDDLCLHLYYDDSDRLEFIEAFGAAKLTLSGINFLGMAVSKAVTALTTLGHSHEIDASGLKSFSAGIALYAPGGIVEGFAVFRRGYYSD